MTEAIVTWKGPNCRPFVQPPLPFCSPADDHPKKQNRRRAETIESLVGTMPDNLNCCSIIAKKELRQYGLPSSRRNDIFFTKDHPKTAIFFQSFFNKLCFCTVSSRSS
mmetsp:Transcript_33641/g.49045  ORF Transcript_33641/g.49045 Transcript_33641/m.49045 type:complete len:108 (+) Transcript_33641:1292-1615(+)